MNEVIKEELKKLKVAYCQTFGTEQGAIVLKDLEKRCYKYNSTFRRDVNETLINEGARQVLLTIENMMGLDVNQPIEREELL